MILFIDTHDSLITIAIKNDDKLFIKEKDSEYSHSVFTMPMIQELFEENNLDLFNLKKIIAVNGPGSFTGVRIGLSIAKTLAYSLNIPIVTISSLTSYLVSSSITTARMCIIEDNKGEYVSVFDSNNKAVIEECYVENNEYNYPIVEEKLNIDKIIDYLEDINPTEVHHVKANYVKKIEVEK